jgi:transglutaminase-like putative cysteine protease
MKIDRMQNKTRRRLSFLFALLLVSSALTSPLITHDTKAGSDSSPIEVSARPSDTGIDKTPAPAAADGRKISRTGNRGLNDASEGLPYQVYVTPDDPAIQGLAAQINSTAEAYALAARWIYVPDQSLLGEVEQWLTPAEFITGTANYPGNPVIGQAVSDCEEQAHALASLIRALDISPEEIRIVLGTVEFGEVKAGHAWVELFADGRWLALDPSSGPYWDDQTGNVINRQGLSFDYYASHDFPVVQSWVYYNDVYYVNFLDGSENAPDSWYPDNSAGW